MAIFSLSHAHLGKSHKAYKPGVAKAHANYITRLSSCRKILGSRAPTERQILKNWLDAEEKGDRANARIIDKLIVALPIELSPTEQEDLLRRFCETATQGRASWVAAIHDRGKDAHNPHAHIILRDRDIETRRRVMLTTELGSTERFRKAWEQATNYALKKAGLDLRIDRRSLKEQGIERDATEHLGPVKTRRGRSDSNREANLPAETLAAEQVQRRSSDSSAYSGSDDREWTSRGGMAAQQWSAHHWVRDSNAAKSAGDGRSARPRFKVQLSAEKEAELARSRPTNTRGGLSR